MRTLEQYFRLHDEKSIDFTLRVRIEDGKCCFYIRPQNVNGETWDFEVMGNNLMPIPNEVLLLQVRINELEDRVKELELENHSRETYELEQRERPD